MACKKQNFISHSSEGWEFNDRVLADLVSGEGCFLMVGYLLTVASHGRRGGGLSRTLMRVLIPGMRAGKFWGDTVKP